MARARKYEPLYRYLAQLPAEQQSVSLTLPEIEALIGSPLARGAWTAMFWSHGPISRTGWGDTGFLARLRRPGHRVEFMRTAGVQRSAACSPADAAIVAVAPGRSMALVARAEASGD